jgi:hypothetical protein
VFSAWDTIETSEFADAVTAACATLFPQDPPRFLARTPHGYTDPPRIVQDLAAAGFTTQPAIEKIAFTSRASSARVAAIAYCHGTPLRGEIEARDPAGLERATQAAQEAVARRFGEGPIEGLIQALVVTAAR